MFADLVSVPVLHLAQFAVDLLLDVQDVQPHLRLRGLQLTLQLLQQGLTVAAVGRCLKRRSYTLLLLLLSVLSEMLNMTRLRRHHEPV